MKILKYCWAKNSDYLEKSLFPNNFPAELKWSRQWEYPWVKEQLKELNNISILDVGKTPDGYMNYIVKNKIISITTNDIGQHGDVNANIIGDIKNRNLFKNKYDVVLSISTIEHDENPLECIKSMLSYLKEKGLLILTMDFCDGNNYTIQRDKLNEIMEFLNIENWYEDSKQDNIIKSEDICVYENLRVVGLVIQK